MITADDYFHNYQNAYVRVTLPKFSEPLVAQIVGIEQDRRPHKILLNTASFGEMKLVFGGKFSIDSTPPPVGFFNHQNTVFQLMRNTPRTRIRGFTAQNIIFTSPIHQLTAKLRSTRAPVAPLSIFHAESAFQGNFPNTLTEALRLLKVEARLGIALSRKYWLAQPIQPKQSYALMTFDLLQVGNIDSHGQIKINELYQHEVSTWLNVYQNDGKPQTSTAV